MLYVVVKNGLYYSGPKTVPGEWAHSSSEPDWAKNRNDAMTYSKDEAERVADTFGGKVCSL